MTSKNLRKELVFGAHAGDRSQDVKIVLATNNTETHLNVFFDYSRDMNRAHTLSSTQAKQLRDALVEAYPIEPEATQPKSKFSVGARVTYVTTVGYGLRGMAGRKGTVVTVLPDEWYEVIFNGGPFDAKIKVHSGYLVADQAASTSRPETTGRFIIHVLEGHRYLPGRNPKVHLTAAAAEAEAQRLAKEHGGTYHVFRASFEASREKPVVPPLKTAKL